MQVSIEWIAVTDRLPDDDERVMIVNAGDVYCGWNVTDDYKSSWYSDDSELLDYVTHWARMPEIPCEASTAGGAHSD